MTKKQTKEVKTLTGREKSLLIVSTVIMIGTIPLTYVFFLLPLLAVPIAVLAILVVLGVIRNSMAIRIIQILSVIGAALALWLMMVLLNYFSIH